MDMILDGSLYKWARIFIFCGIFCWTTQALGRDVVAKKDGVSVYQEANKGSAVVLTLKNGQTMPALDRLGMFWQVDNKGSKAYVFLTDVTVRNGADATTLSGVLRDAVQKNRNDAQAVEMRSRSAVMGVRGLDQSDADFAGNSKPNLRMVYDMEGLNISSSNIQKIQASVDKEIEGKLAQ